MAEGRYRRGLYDIAIAITDADMKVSGDGKVYLMVDREVTIDQKVGIDELYLRPKLQVKIWIEINDQHAKQIRDRKALRAAIMNSPVLI